MSLSKRRGFRQIHLDFHTSPQIPKIGKRFQAKAWQETLKRAAVDSITLFAKCHHGWSYHPTKVGKIHPHLDFDLLRRQYEACKEIGLQVPLYLSAGVDNLASYEHPEWRELGSEGKYLGWSTRPIDAGFHTMDFHSPYLNYLCDQIHEVISLFPDCDGIFLDIISQSPCCGRWSLEYMEKVGLDPEKEEDRKKSAEEAVLIYYQKTTSACRANSPAMPVFHNGGHIPRGRHDLYSFFSHLELESLPTGGWGYDHFPEAAKYCTQLSMEFVGQTGKFHTTWGEFGGFKHPNALRYECSAMLAFGAKCNIGDQLHPEAELDSSTYEIIGEAYREVATKEAWCENASPIYDLAILSSESELPDSHGRGTESDTGATRVLLEGHFLFGLIDRGMDFKKYKGLVLPDEIIVDDVLRVKLEDYIAEGGKVFMTGLSGLKPDRSGFALPIGADFQGESELSPAYILPIASLQPSFVKSPLVIYLPSQRVIAREGKSLGQVFDPYFNRTYQHFCSHQHTPPRPDPSGFDAGVEFGPITYWAFPFFSLYRGWGAVAYQEILHRSLKRFLGTPTLETNLPSTARVSLMRQELHHRTVLHLLYASKLNRGGEMMLQGGNLSKRAKSIEVIEELLPLRDSRVKVHLPHPVQRVSLEPSGIEMTFQQNNGWVEIEIPEWSCHQMVVFHDRE
ncbi:MAG: alpha-amylase family protein [Verrucomicrobiota bacterium]